MLTTTLSTHHHGGAAPSPSTWDVSPAWVEALGCAAIAHHHLSTHHYGGAASSPSTWDVSPAWVEALRCAAIAEGALSGAAQRALNACYLGGPLLQPQGHQVPGARAGSCSLRLSEVMGARTLPGPKPAKKRPMCSPPGAGRKGKESAHTPRTIGQGGVLRPSHLHALRVENKAACRVQISGQVIPLCVEAVFVFSVLFVRWTANFDAPSREHCHLWFRVQMQEVDIFISSFAFV